MNQKPTQATVIATGWKGVYTAESKDKRILHIEASDRRKPLGIGDRVLCDGIALCSGDAIASKYKLVARANHSPARL